MSVENTTSREQPRSEAAHAYEPPHLTRYGSIEEWTQGVLGGISISIVL